MPLWISVARGAHTNIHVCNFAFTMLPFIRHNTTDTNKYPPTQRLAHPNTPLKLTRLVWAALVGYWPRLNQAEPASGVQTGRQSGSVRGWCNVKAEERERGLRGLKQSLFLSVSRSITLFHFLTASPCNVFPPISLSLDLLSHPLGFIVDQHPLIKKCSKQSRIISELWGIHCNFVNRLKIHLQWTHLNLMRLQNHQNVLSYF